VTPTLDTRPNPYVGPRAFRQKEKLYGRDRETLRLLDLLIAERVVLLYSPSGAGKTSLLQATLVPSLIKEGFRVLPIMRVNLAPPPDCERVPSFNRYLLSAMLCLDAARPREQQAAHVCDLAAMRIDEYLARRPRVVAEPDIEVLIFDQFEEILTVEPVDHDVKARFFSEIGAVLRDRKRWAVFSMREDFIAGLDPFLRSLPTRLHTRFRLDFLEKEQARQAVRYPAAAAAIDFSEAAANKLVEDLSRVRTQRPDGSTEERAGSYVEPVQLQVVCHRLWERVPPERAQITETDIETVGRVDEALADYYQEQLLAVATETGVSERAIREWFEQKLITEQGFRGQVLQGPPGATDAAARALQLLQDAHLIRADNRRGAMWYELAHDRLITPVRANNAEWGQKHLTALQQQAVLWRDAGRPEALLLRNGLLLNAEAWAERNDSELNELEREFLNGSQKERVRARRRRRGRWVVRALVVTVVLASLAAGILGLNAKKQKDLAYSRLRVLEAVRSLDVDPERSIQLALLAVDSRKAGPGELTVEEQDILHRAVEASRVRATLVRSKEPFVGLALNGDGSRLVTATANGKVQVWDPRNQRSLLDLRNGNEATTAVAIDRKGDRIATGQYKFDDATRTFHSTVRILNSASGDLMTKFSYDGLVNTVAFSPNGGLLASGSSDKTVRLWNVATTRQVHTIRVGSDVLRVEFSPDGQRLATAGADKLAKVWDVASGHAVMTLRGHTAEVWDVAFSPDGRHLATASLDSTAKIWDAATGRETANLSGHSNTVLWVGFAPDGRIGTASADGTARLWDESGQPLLTLLGHTNPISAAAFTAAGSELLTATWDGTVRIWDASTNHTRFVSCIAFSPDGRRVATGSADTTVKIWDVASRRQLGQLTGQKGTVWSVTFSPNGKRIATAGNENVARIWDVRTGRLLRTLQHDGIVNSVAFSLNGRWMATASADKTARIWDMKTGQSLRTLRPAASVRAVAFSRDGTHLATVSDDWSVRIWDTATGKLVTQIWGNALILSAVFSPSGRLVASAGLDKTVTLWDTSTGNRVRTLSGHTNVVSGVAFSPDGQRLATGSWDSTARVWSVDSGKQLLTLSHPAQVNDVAFSPQDEDLLATASSDRSFHLYNLNQKALLQLARRRVTSSG
jgi:WD40 repeat protein